MRFLYLFQYFFQLLVYTAFEILIILHSCKLVFITFFIAVPSDDIQVIILLQLIYITAQRPGRKPKAFSYVLAVKTLLAGSFQIDFNPLIKISGSSA